jgi:hypothetical protein
MQPPDQSPTSQPVYPGAAYPGYGAQPPPEQSAAPPYGGATQPYGYYAPMYAQPAVPQTSGFAVASLICGVASWFLFFFIGGILAVVFGHMARREIRQSQGWKRGDGLAISGLIIGYFNILASVIVFLVFLWLALAFASDGYRN